MKTYIRPWYLRVVDYLLSMLIFNVAMFIMIFFLLWGLTGDHNTLSYGTIFGDVPTWFVFWFTFFIMSPILSFVIWIQFPKKYDREYKKGLIPYFNNHPLFYARKIANAEPEWRLSECFQAILKFDSIEKYGSFSFACLQDVETQFYYLMFSDRFNKLKANINGLYEGTWDFDTNWRITNIYKVE
jgi:hypothetical protein